MSAQDRDGAERRAFRRVFRDGARVAWPDLDVDVFLHAFDEINRFRRECGEAFDAAEICRGAIEVAKRRAAAEIPSERRSDDHGREN